MNTIEKENERLTRALRDAEDRNYELDFDRRTWKTGFWLMNLIVACYVAFCLCSGNSLHG